MRVPLFICGFPSGGTDLLKTVLNAHPDVYINGEMPFLADILQLGYDCDTQFSTMDEIAAFIRSIEKLDEYGNFENIRYDYSTSLSMTHVLTLQHVIRKAFSSSSSPVWGNKTPQNTENITRLAKIFPGAKFLVITRDVRDVCLSHKNKWGKDMYLCADKWSSRMKSGWIASQQLDLGSCYFLKFEDLLSDTEYTAQEICKFVDIPFSPLMLEHHVHMKEGIDGKINYGQPVISSNQKKWLTSLTGKSINRIESIAFDSMTLLGYQIEYSECLSELSIVERILGRFRDILALIAVGNRASGNNGFFSRVGNVSFELKKLFLKSTRRN
jgi:hypothetical protein